MDVSSGNRVAPELRFATALVITLGVGAILYLAREVLIPLALAMLLGFALSPLTAALQRVGAPRGIAAAAPVLVAFLVVGSVGYLAYTQAYSVANEIPKYRTIVAGKVSALMHGVEGNGPFSEAAKVFTELSQSVENGEAAGTGDAKPPPQRVVVKTDEGQFSRYFGLLAPVLAPFGTLAIVFLLTTFMLAQREDIRNRLIKLAGAADVLLATPLTICLVVMGRHVDGLAFLDTILGNQPPLSPPELFYQRMLAGDPSEARQMARRFLRDQSIDSYFDTVALPALRRAHTDIGNGAVAGPRLAKLTETTEGFLQGLPGYAMRWRGLSAPLARPTKASRQSPALPKPCLVAVLHGDDPLDVSAAAMLGIALQKRSYQTRILSIEAAGQAELVTETMPQIIVLSFVEPLSTLHLRAVSMAVRRRAPNVRVMLCIWREMAPEMADEIRRVARVNDVAFNIEEAAGQVERCRRQPALINRNQDVVAAA